MITRARLRQWRADLLAAFWLRPAVMAVAGAALSELLVLGEGWVTLPSWIASWTYAGDASGARDVLGAIATSAIAVAGTTFSITVAALSFAAAQMGPRLLRNFTRDPGNQYVLGVLVGTFTFALTALRAVREADEGDDLFVPQLAVTGSLLLAFACIGALTWFLDHVANGINVSRVVALVHEDLHAAVVALRPHAEAAAPRDPAPGEARPLRAPGWGYLQVLDHDALADWAAERGAVVRMLVRPGDFVFPGSVVGEVSPPALGREAEEALGRRMTLGDTRSAEQDIEYAVRQLVEVALRALSPSLNDPFTAAAVLDRLGAALCQLADRDLPDGVTERDGRVRVVRPATGYGHLVDAMFDPLREAGEAQPVVVERLLAVLEAVAGVERDPARRRALRRHAALARDAGLRGTADPAARANVTARAEAALAALDGAPAAAA